MRSVERARREAEVLQANAELYRAFRDGDFAAMEELWAQSVEVACLHPGSQALTGRRAVLESFRGILAASPGWDMTQREARAFLLPGDAAFVTCLEANGNEPAHLAATNVFVREGERWRLAHHQAGPLSRPVPPGPSPSEVN
jgi:ketosteroid isomerase-like protein